MIYLGEAEGEGKEEWRMGAVDLGDTNPFSFHRTKAPCLFDLSLELFDLESIQLLGSHVH